MKRQVPSFAIFAGSGVAIGVATHHLAMWIAIGVAMALAASQVARKNSQS